VPQRHWLPAIEKDAAAGKMVDTILSGISTQESPLRLVLAAASLTGQARLYLRRARAAIPEESRKSQLIALESRLQLLIEEVVAFGREMEVEHTHPDG
jgi:hypothetical protein